MEGLLSLLLLAGLFYLMMRFGCGAHMVHGHRGHAGRGGENSIDPVCDMDMGVDADKGYGKMYQGRLYRFCSRSCLDKFYADPQRYLDKPPDKADDGEYLP